MSSAPRDGAGGPTTASSPDPLRLCVYATIAALAWWLGPFALLAFAALGLAGYLRARRVGLTRSTCVLRDTRLVIGYLAVLAATALVGIGFVVADWVR
ncbi:hypothetical protein ABLG96_05395 [Nakamurella sp. A5-74]|uniref:DUF4190 domain-containing protein n=1 Tax=Nakamurella sp. A5-74 TaxID=3158264 RepID=A0AAU8DV60_9ACTN